MKQASILRRGLAVAAAGVMMGTYGCAAAQPKPPPCTAPALAEFDFWVGEWDVRWTDADGKPQHGRNTITRTLDGCVILEQFDGRPGSPLVGLSVSTFDAKAGKWKQIWVDNHGSYLDFEGGKRNGTMVLSRTVPHAGSGAMQRMIFSDIAKDSLTWDWQGSKDGGQTWTTQWRILYTRRK